MDIHPRTIINALDKWHELSNNNFLEEKIKKINNILKKITKNNFN